MTDRVTKPRARKKKVAPKPNVVVAARDGSAPAQTPSTRRDSALTTKLEHSDSESSLHNVPFSASSDGNVLPPEAEKAIATIRYQYRAPQLYQPCAGHGLSPTFRRDEPKHSVLYTRDTLAYSSTSNPQQGDQARSKAVNTSSINGLLRQDTP